MGIAVPVLLVIADLATQRCSFVCLNDYIDKILIPRFKNYRDKQSRTIHIPIYNEIRTDHGLVALRWYAKRPKLLAAFQLRILLDECAPRPWKRELVDYEIRTVVEMGWSGKKNGELLRLMCTRPLKGSL